MGDVWDIQGWRLILSLVVCIIRCALALAKTPGAVTGIRDVTS